MISFIRGTVCFVDTDSAVIDVCGVGYNVFMPTKALASLPKAGLETQVFTYMHVKDDGFSLYGFSSIEQRQLFERLISVSGVGPKSALAALSTFKTSDLLAAIADEDLAALCTIPGIGKKAASRIILDLQGKLKTEMEDGQLNKSHSNELKEAKAALVAMGFSSTEASSAFNGVDWSNESATELIKLGLKNLGAK